MTLLIDKLSWLNSKTLILVQSKAKQIHSKIWSLKTLGKGRTLNFWKAIQNQERIGTTDVNWLTQWHDLIWERKITFTSKRAVSLVWKSCIFRFKSINLRFINSSIERRKCEIVLKKCGIVMRSSFRVRKTKIRNQQISQRTWTLQI